MKWRVTIELDSREDAELLAAMFPALAVAVEPVWPRAPVVHEVTLADAVPVRDGA